MNLLKIKNLPVLPVYPLLFGLYPVLYLWNANRAQQPAYVIIPSLLLTLASLLLIYTAAFLVLRDIHRAALLATIFSLYILSYGHIANLVNGETFTIPQPYLLAGSGLLVLGVLLYLAMRRVGSPSLTRVFNVIAAALVLFQLVSAAPYYISRAQLDQKQQQARLAQQAQIPVTGITRQNPSPTPEDKPRDVYFILLDNYGRQDVLLKKSRFDNSELVNALKDRGFIFPDCAQSNYPHTVPVVAAVLNMNYLDTFGLDESAYMRRGRYEATSPLIHNSRVMRMFEDYGYHTVTFRGFMGLIDIHNSDTYVSFDKDLAITQRLETAAFQDLYFKTTIFSPINERYQVYPEMIAEKSPGFLAKFVPPGQVIEDKFYKVYQQNVYAFDALEEIPKKIESPKFVYAHIFTAHWPFMLNPDGTMRLPFTEKMTVEGYVDAVKYTNSRVLDAIDSILENSETEPVIILQGDHSDGWEGKVEWSGVDRMKILSAYYLPDGGDALLYDEISPVNNFRLIFSHYFGEPLDLLPDQANYLNPETRKLDVAPRSCISDSIP